MNDFKDFALELHEKGIKATMDNARTFVLGNYDRVLPAYWLNPDARIKALYALMETRYVDDFESSLKATLTLSSELDQPLSMRHRCSTARCSRSSTTNTARSKHDDHFT